MLTTEAQRESLTAKGWGNNDNYHASRGYEVFQKDKVILHVYANGAHTIQREYGHKIPLALAAEAAAILASEPTFRTNCKGVVVELRVTHPPQ
jgi:hypothetical protein